jgi:hypothetical protein
VEEFLDLKMGLTRMVKYNLRGVKMILSTVEADSEKTGFPIEGGRHHEVNKMN